MGYLGVDESNHGRYPEIFVGRYTTNPSDAEKNTQFSKKRSKNNIAMHALDYRFFSLTKDMGELITPRYGMVISIAEFLKFFESRGQTLEKIVVDGLMTSDQVEELNRVVYPRRLPLLVDEIQADKSYRCVNEADHIANGIFRLHDQRKDISSDIRKRELFCDPKREYAELVKKIAEQRMTSSDKHTREKARRVLLGKEDSRFQITKRQIHKKLSH